VVLAAATKQPDRPLAPQPIGQAGANAERTCSSSDAKPDALDSAENGISGMEGLFEGHIPGDIEHVTGRFLIGTGSGGQIFRDPGFQQEHKFVNRYVKEMKIVMPGGINGRRHGANSHLR
jgi:hypothetical protein